MGNIVKLVFQAIDTGSGFSKMYGEVKGLAAAMPGLTKATMILGSAFGSVGASVGRMATMLLQGGIWGVAAEGAKLLIDKLGLFKDKTEETKAKLDKLAEASRKFYETINANSQKSLEKIDKETKRRNEQLDITNRMIKAELQLQKARAIASGDTKGVERIDRQISEQDQKTALQKANFAADSSAKRRDEAEAKMAETIAAEAKAARELADAEAALESKSKPVTTIMQSSAGAFVQTQTRDTTAEKAAVEAAKKRLEIARQQTAEAKTAYGIERDKYEFAVANVKALKAEQEAADAEAAAKRLAEATKAAKDLAAKDREKEKKFEEEEKKRIALEEAEEKAFKKRQLAESLRQLQEELKAEQEMRKKELQEDLKANSARADDLKAKLSAAIERANAARDIFGNAGNMDQSGDLSAKRREAITNTRFANGAIDLIGSGKIRRGPNGEWIANGRLSNLNKAILERLNADENKRKLEKENDKVVKKLDELKKAIEQMSTL